MKCKSGVAEIDKEHKKIDQKSKETLCIIVKYFTKQETMLLNILMIILQRYLNQNIKQPERRT